MHCYKCKETDPNKLSLKKQQRGIMTFICRTCRNTAANAWAASRRKNRREYTNIAPEAWDAWARESRLRIAQHHS